MWAWICLKDLPEYLTWVNGMCTGYGYAVLLLKSFSANSCMGRLKPIVWRGSGSCICNTEYTFLACALYLIKKNPLGGYCKMESQYNRDTSLWWSGEVAYKQGRLGSQRTVTKTWFNDVGCCVWWGRGLWQQTRLCGSDMVSLAMVGFLQHSSRIPVWDGIQVW